MKEDIKLVENLIEEYKMFGDLDGIQDIRPYMKAIENMLNRNKELEEENEIIKGNYYTLCADIQMVTSELGFPEDTIIADEMVAMIKENYIPKSVIKEKIDKKQKQLELLKKELQGRQTNFVNKNIITGQIQVLQELLEKRKYE